MQTKSFSISGVWIFEFFFVIVFNRRAPCFFAWGKFFDESTLGFLCFFVFGGLFAISGVWIFGFQSIQTLAYVRISISGPKKHGIVGHWRFSCTLEF